MSADTQVKARYRVTIWHDADTRPPDARAIMDALKHLNDAREDKVWAGVHWLRDD